MTVEEHGGGRQLVRLRMRPRFAWKSIWFVPLFLALSVASGADGAWWVCAILSLITLFLAVRPLKESALAMNTVKSVLRGWKAELAGNANQAARPSDTHRRPEEAAVES